MGEMASADEHQYDEQLLARYLLGAVSEEEAERLDESSITDAEFALHLDAVENDLVDAYVQGELSGDTLQRFQKFYLSSPRRRQKVEFARTLVRYDEKAATAPVQAHTSPSIPSPRQQSYRWFVIPRLDLQWVGVAVALVMLLASGYLFVENQRLRKQGTGAREQQAALDQRVQELERELSDERSANTGMLKELERLRKSLAAPHALKIVAALLLPQTRGVGQISTISIPQGTDRVALRLELESDDNHTYRVALKDPGTNRIIWRSRELQAKSEGGTRTVSISLPASMLKQQTYSLELVGTSQNSAPEFITSYFFRMVVE